MIFGASGRRFDTSTPVICGSFGLCCFGCGSGLLGAAAACGLGLLGFAEHVLVEVYEFDEAHFGVVAEAVTGFEDACVTAGTVAYFSGYC